MGNSISRLKALTNHPPTPADFGLTAEDLAVIKGLESAAKTAERWQLPFLTAPAIIGLVLPFALAFNKVNWIKGVGLSTFLLSGLFVTLVYLLVFVPFIERRLHRHPKYRGYLEFTDAVTQYEKSKRAFWLNLSGLAFEQQLADLYTRLGFSANVTKASGDEGVDIVLTRNRKTIIVQCKQHSKPVGPAIVRELYGAMISFKADSAILACTSGFTVGVSRFVKGKPIELIDVDAILRMQEKLNSDVVNNAQGVILCPPHSDRRGRTAA